MGDTEQWNTRAMHTSKVDEYLGFRLMGKRWKTRNIGMHEKRESSLSREHHFTYFIT